MNAPKLPDLTIDQEALNRVGSSVREMQQAFRAVMESEGPKITKAIQQFREATRP